MLPLSPNTFWLTKATYIDSHRAVFVEFSNRDCLESRKFHFFPEMLLPKSFSASELPVLLSRNSPKKFRVIVEKNCFRVVAASFSDLCEFGVLIEKNFSFSPAIIEPERQFLALYEWNYFDAFNVYESEATKIAFAGVPDARIEHLAGTVSDTFSEMFSGNPEAGRALAEKIVSSHIAKIPPEKVFPDSDIAELFLENLLFSNRVFFAPQKGIALQQQPRTYSTQDFFSEIDFSQMWAELLTKHFFNLGFETVDCNCCRPGTIFEGNVLPNSLVIAEFNSDGMFFDSWLPEFARSFHSLKEGKGSREKRKREFFLQEHPVGPFYRGQRESIPVVDAIALSSKGFCKIVSNAEMHWHCVKQESFLSAEISMLKQKIAEALLPVSRIEQEYKRSHGLIYSEKLRFCPEHAFFDCLKIQLEQILFALPKLLSSQRHGVFFPNFCSALSSVKALSTGKFRNFAAENGLRKVVVSAEKAFFSSDSALETVSDFSRKEHLPSPIIVRDRGLRNFQK